MLRWSRAVLVASALALTGVAWAKDEPPPDESRPRVEARATVAGLVGVAWLHQGGVLTFGGPRLVLDVGDFHFVLSFYPSVASRAETRFSPRPLLGFGPEVGWRRLALIFPIYHVDDRFRPASGVGVSF